MCRRQFPFAPEQAPLVAAAAHKQSARRTRTRELSLSGRLFENVFVRCNPLWSNVRATPRYVYLAILGRCRYPLRNAPSESHGNPPGGTRDTRRHTTLSKKIRQESGGSFLSTDFRRHRRLLTRPGNVSRRL